MTSWIMQTTNWLAPTFFIIGSPRAGTTALYDTLLSNEPRVVAATTKEINYFNSPLWQVKPRRWYLSQFGRRGTRTGELSGDGSCTSVLCPLVPERVHSTVPSVSRLLLCIRDEVRRIQSHYRMCKENEANDAAQPRGTLPHDQPPALPPLEELIEVELRHISRCNREMPAQSIEERFASCYLQVRATCSFSSAVMPATLANQTSSRPGCHHLLTGSMYALQLLPWLRIYSPDQLLLVQKRDLEEAPAATLAVVGTFLGLRRTAVRRPLQNKPKRPKRRTFPGKASLSQKMQRRLKSFFVSHQLRLAQLLATSDIKITRLTSNSAATYRTNASHLRNKRNMRWNHNQPD
mmetsp:Transcript_7471/g.12675  ORF Transcript_7471/g.12675 Transcript_7471/m.12675 type:complete len:349 (-) Transcript_7471:190-1236(-)